MKKTIIAVAGMFALSVATPAALTLLAPSDVLADGIVSETKKAENDAKKKGAQNAKNRKAGKKASAKGDGYKDMTDGEKDAYKKGYRDEAAK